MVEPSCRKGEIENHCKHFYIRANRCSNQLIKAKKDGSQRVVLDGEDTFDYEIEKVEDKYIYYRKNGITYKIGVDGNNKEILE